MEPPKGRDGLGRKERKSLFWKQNKRSRAYIGGGRELREGDNPRHRSLGWKKGTVCEVKDIRGAGTRGEEEKCGCVSHGAGTRRGRGNLTFASEKVGGWPGTEGK